MAGSVNKVILVGNLGRDPEIRQTGGGDTVATLSLATAKSWKDRQGEKQERTEWHRVVMFGKLAEIAERWLSKGSKVYIEGELRTRKWQDKSGQDRYITEVLASGFEGKLVMLGGDRGGGRREEAAPVAEPAEPDDIPF